MSTKTKDDQIAQKSNIMTPLNWFSGIIETILGGCLIGTHAVKLNWAPVALFILMLLMIIFYCAMYAYFAIKKPELLQTENYRLADKKLALNAGPIKKGTSLIETEKTNISSNIQASSRGQGGHFA